MPGWRRALATALVGSIAFAACGGGEDDKQSSGTTVQGSAISTQATPSTTQPAADPNGVVRTFFATLATAPSIFDPTRVVDSTVFDVSRLVYDTLLRQSPDGSIAPGMAKAATIVSPTQIDIELNSGITFTDGTKLDADGAKANFDRNLKEGKAAGFRAEYFQIDRVDVTGPLTFTLRLKTPVAGTLYPRLALHEGMLLSPAAIAAGKDMRYEPVGAGPFMVSSFDSDRQKLVLRKNPTYFQADQIRLSGIEISQPGADPAATLNALLADQADWIMPTFTQLDGLKGRPGLKTDVRVSADQGDNIVYCKSSAPFNDVRVRQALNFAVDRDAINNVLYGGLGEPAKSLFPKSNPLYDADLKDIYPHDTAKAKALLADAGYPTGLKFELTVQPATLALGEAIQQQVKDAGFDITLRQTQNIVADFYQGVKTPAAISTYTGAFALGRNYIPGPVGNVCGYDNANLTGLLNSVAAVDRASDESKKLWKQIDEFFVRDQALAVHLVYKPLVNAWRDRLAGVTFVPDILGRPSIDLFRVYVKR